MLKNVRFVARGLNYQFRQNILNVCLLSMILVGSICFWLKKGTIVLAVPTKSTMANVAMPTSVNNDICLNGELKNEKNALGNLNIDKFNILFTKKTAVEMLQDEEKKKTMVLGEQSTIPAAFIKWDSLAKGSKLIKDNKAQTKFLQQQKVERELQLCLYRKQVKKHLQVALRQAMNMATSVNIAALYKRLEHHLSYFLEINQEGFIRNIFLTSPTGIKEFDEFLITAIRKAVPFPAIPKHLAIKYFSVFD